jgi:hypothetical protein
VKTNEDDCVVFPDCKAETEEVNAHDTLKADDNIDTSLRVESYTEILGSSFPEAMLRKIRFIEPGASEFSQINIAKFKIPEIIVRKID